MTQTPRASEDASDQMSGWPWKSTMAGLRFGAGACSVVLVLLSLLLSLSLLM